MTDSKALIERLRAKYTVTDEFSTIRRPVNPDGFEAADHIEKLEAEVERLTLTVRKLQGNQGALEADKARLEDALRQAVMDAAEWARKAGEAQGKLEISEAAGILDGWIRDCEQRRGDKALLREALDKDAARFERCADMISDGGNPSGTLRVERFLQAKQYAADARAALQETSQC